MSMYDTAVNENPMRLNREELHDLRRCHAERSDGDLGTEKDIAIADFIEWAFSKDRDEEVEG